MTDERDTSRTETVVVESRGGGAGMVTAIALLIVVVAVLAYLGMLPI